MGRLVLVPVDLTTPSRQERFDPFARATIHRLSAFAVENERSARRFLRDLEHPQPITELRFWSLEETPLPAPAEEWLKDGHDLGVLSEAGCPAIADPGNHWVRRCHELNIRVVPLVGPSSLLLALMASGLNGQQFFFHGYLPIGEQERLAAISDLGKSRNPPSPTHLFIETPYRNNGLLHSLVKALPPEALLCVACGLTTDEEWIQTKRVRQWKKSPPQLPKVPAIFLFQVNP
jgi:16S rRNA (cytidine1402-2'-O)-methyltransferase